MLEKCPVNGRKAEEGAFVYMHASPELKWRSVLKSLREKVESLEVDEAHLLIWW